MFTLKIIVYEYVHGTQNAEIFHVKEGGTYSSQCALQRSYERKILKIVPQHTFVNKILPPASAFCVHCLLFTGRINTEI